MAIHIKSKIPHLSEGAKLTQKIVYRPVDELKPFEGNPRVHSSEQIQKLAAAISEFGFRGAIVISEAGTVLSGHGRLEAVKLLNFVEVPTITAYGLTLDQQRAFVLADNKISELSHWDQELLSNQIQLLQDTAFEIETTGFSTAEIDLILDSGSDLVGDDPDDEIPVALDDSVVTRPGDVWVLGKHRLVCGNALEHDTYDLLMQGKRAQLVVTDPPYNVEIQGHVCGNGKVKHSEFEMAAGEMSPAAFTEFLNTSFGHAASFMEDGALLFSYMDWRHQRELLDAAEPLFGSLMQLCVWVKSNGGMGTFYRSQHELVFIFKNGKRPHINNFKLGQYGRYRTNVWQYPGVNSFGPNQELLKLHPTVKPVGMIADILRDCSKHNQIILDPFAGSGTLLLAAERTGRSARAIELDPKYCDVAIARWQTQTGSRAIHEKSGATYSDMAEARKDGQEECYV